MTRTFGTNELLYILQATQWTVALSGIAFLCGGIIGLLVAVLRISPYAPLRWLSSGYIQLFQGTPLLMQLFLAYFGLAVLGLELDPWTAVTLGFTLHASAFLGDIWQGCLRAVPFAQWEASRALSLSYFQALRRVIGPQALKISVAPTVGFLVQLIKGTALASIIGFVELTRAGQLINNVTFNPMLVYGLVATIYFCICFPLAHASTWFERHLNRPLGR